MVSKTNKELLTDMSMACSDMYQAKLHFTPPEATGCQEEIDKAVKEDPTPYLLYENFLIEVNNMREYLSTGAEGRREQLLLDPIFDD